jgi:6-phosphogluconolactonase
VTLREFPSAAAFNDALAQLLLEQFQQPVGSPYAVMLAGGSTPLAAYRQVAQRHPQAGPGLHLLFSDERMVPKNSPLSNTGNARGLLDVLGPPPARLLDVHTELSLTDAAQQWHADLESYFRLGGKLPLGLLGLGADGHTASLFSRADVERGHGCYAIPVPRPAGPDRVSVTIDVLARAERIVFAVAGPDRSATVAQLLRAPSTLPAGLAVAGVAQVELFYSASTV